MHDSSDLKVNGICEKSNVVLISNSLMPCSSCLKSLGIIYSTFKGNLNPFSVPFSVPVLLLLLLLPRFLWNLRFLIPTRNLTGIIKCNR